MKTPKTLTALFSRKSRWTQGQFARNRNGNKCDNFSSTAESFCLAGGIRRVYGIDGFYRAAEDITKHLRRRRHSFLASKGIVNWNDADKRTFADIQQAARWIDRNAKKLGLRPNEVDQ